MALSLSGISFRPGLYPTLAFVLLFPLLISLGIWQLHRAAEKQALITAREQRLHDLPVDLNLARRLDPGDRFRSAAARGHFVPGRQWLQDNRVHEGQPGYHVYSLFELDGSGGRCVLVNRGWVPVGVNRQQLPSLPLPEGEFQLQGRLDQPASVGIAVGEVDYAAPGLTVSPYLKIADLRDAIGRDVFGMALELDAGQPGSLTPDPLPMVQMGPERHLGYAVQWFGLATALLMIYVGVNVRRLPQKEDSLS